MIPKTKHFDWIEDYCLGQLSESQTLEFEAELGRNSELKERVEFELDLQSAITEKDVLELRDKIETVAKQTLNDEIELDTFNMLEDYEGIQDLNQTLAPEDLLNFYDSLPKVHVYQHELVSNENIHQYYKEQDHYQEEMKDFESSLGDMDLEDLEGLDEAILEKDILDLRNTLSQVAKSVKPQFSASDIDDYVSGEMKGNVLKDFEEELSKNRNLKEEVEVHKEVELAVNELDVRNLRDELSHIMETETSWNVSEQSIEEYIDGELEGEMLEEFVAEMNENTDLRAEVSLRKNVNASIGEKDIFSLRSKLEQVKADADSKEVKSIIPNTENNLMSWWKVGAAVVILVFAVSGVLKMEFGSINKALDERYSTLEWSPERAVNANTDLNYLQEANNYVSNGEFNEALKTYDAAINEMDETFPYSFWKADLLQDMGKYREAISEYTRVIEQGNNQFIEEAEWYKSYCYLKLEEWDAAKEQLLAIIERKGYFENDAKAILRRLKYSLK